MDGSIRNHWRAALVAGLVWAAPAAGKSSRLSPALVQQIKSESASYVKCRRTAMRLVKEGRLTADGVKKRLNACREQFPAAEVFVACKKQAAKLGGRKKVKTAVTRCRRLLARLSFDDKKDLPFAFHGQDLFLAGLGLNYQQNVRDLKPAGFDCSPVREATQSLERAEFFLFGEHPLNFKGFADLRPARLAGRFRLGKKIDPAGHLVPDLGKIFHHPRLKQSRLYFPVAPCIYKGELGPRYLSLSAYYLIDRPNQVAYPYFGIVFFRKGAKTVTFDIAYSQIRTLVKAALKSKLRRYSAPKTPTLKYLSSKPIGSWDDEGDPANLCAHPRPHSYLAAIKRRDNNRRLPEYALIANVKNLCAHGDAVSRRF